MRLLRAILVAIGLLAAGTLSAQSAPSDAAAKAAIMASDAWKQMADGYQKWLNSQAIYTADDLKRINANLAAQLQAMPASEMQTFLDEWQAKLKVLNGKDFQESQQWLGEYMSALTDGYRNKILQNLGLTDVASMTADQLEDAMIQIRADKLASQRSQASFNRTRQQQVQTVQQANATAQQLQQQEAAQARTPQFNGSSSPYRPTGLYNPPPRFQSQFYVDGAGQVGYMLPF